MMMLESSIDLATISLWLGHENIRSSQAYLQAHMALKGKAPTPSPPSAASRPVGPKTKSATHATTRRRPPDQPARPALRRQQVTGQSPTKWSCTRIGVTWEHSAHLYYRRAMSAALLLGGSTHYRSMVAAAVFD
jgi:hypothetical protein